MIRLICLALLGIVPSIASAGQQAAAGSPEWLIGNWTNSSNCTPPTTVFRADGSFTHRGGSGQYLVTSQRLMLGGTLFTIEQAGPGMFVVSLPGQGRATFTRCSETKQERGMQATPLMRPYPTASTQEQSRNRSVPEVPDAAATCGRSIRNGEVLDPLSFTPQEVGHQVNIDNGSRGPALVKLFNHDTQQRILFFVERGGKAGISGLPDGQYSIQYAIGGTLAADCQTIIRPVHVAEFPGAKDMRIVETPTRYQTKILSLTLYEVRGGNVATEDIPVGEFNRD